MNKLTVKTFFMSIILVFLLAACSSAPANNLDATQPGGVSPTATQPAPASTPTQTPMTWPSEKPYFAAYDPVTQRVLLIGRDHDTQDMWAYDASSQTLTRLKDKPASSVDCMVYDSQAAGVITNNQNLGNTMFYDPKLEEWKKLSSSKAGGWSDLTIECPIAYDAESARTILIAGIDNGKGGIRPLTQTYNFTSDSWEEVKIEQSLPTGNLGMAMAYDQESDLTIYWDASVSQRVWSFDANSGAWKEIPYTGGPEKGGGFGAMVYVPDLDRIFVYYMDQFYSYDTSTNTWEKAGEELLPGSRTMQAMAYDPVAKKIVVYGGIRENGSPLKDLWLYDPVSGSWTEQPQP
jgi:hypothetical protein